MTEQISTGDTHPEETNTQSQTECFETILFEAIHLDYIDHYCVKPTEAKPQRTADTPDEPRDASTRKRTKPTDVWAELPNLRREKMVREPYGFCVVPSTPKQMKLLVPCVYLSGKYIKYQRHMAQTPWWVGSGPDRVRIGSSSVEEAIGSSVSGITGRMFDGSIFPPHAEDASRFSFYSLGREDRDVRMLGEGRPFLLKIKGATRIPPVPREKAANGTPSVRVHSLRYAAPRYVEWLKDPQKEHLKAYRAIVFCQRPFSFAYGVTAESGTGHADFNCLIGQPEHRTADLFTRLGSNTLTHSGQPIQILQKTPIRVCHRRAHLERAKSISKLEIRLLNAHCAVLDVVCSAGTYVKEFVHGDHGRTSPSLSDFLHAPCDILQLDVMDIES